MNHQKRTMKVFFFVAVLLLLILTVIVYAKEMEQRKFSEKLDGAKNAEVRIKLEMAEVKIGPGAPDELVSFNAEYDASILEPRFKIRRKGDQAFITIDSKMKKKRNNYKDKNIDNSFSIALSTTPEYDLSAELGLGDNSLDLTDMKIRSLELKSGLAETDIQVSKPNPISADYVKIESGLGEITTDHLGNLRFRNLEFEGGLGSSSIDFRGFSGEGDAKLSIGMGTAEILIPRNLGVRLLYKDSFLSSVDFSGFTEVSRGRYESVDYADKKDHLEIKLEAGLGSVEIIWKD